MDFSSNVAFLELFLDIISRRTGEIGKVSYRPQKPAFDLDFPEDAPLPRSTPEEQGISSEWTADLLHELGEAAPLHMHQFMLLRHGKVISETAFDPYQTGIWHATYSMCKSFAGMAIGLLADDGKIHLDDQVLSFFPGVRNPIHIMRLRDLTVRHLLTMSSGIAFNEMGAISGDDWASGFFSSSVRFAPGTQFNYNSMNTFLLSAIVTKVTGQSLYDFLKERLFEPLGIRQAFWESSPTGITKGGWGMYLRPEDAARLGLLYLNKGCFQGRQLISEKWVSEAVKLQISTGRVMNPGYGYQVWMDMLPESYVFNGMLGQNVHVYPTLDMILVTNAGNAEIFADQNGLMNSILSRYLHEDFHPGQEALPPDPEALGRLRSLEAHYAGKDLAEEIPSPDRSEKETERSSAVHPALRGGWKKRRSGAQLLRKPARRDLPAAAEPARYSVQELLKEQAQLAREAFEAHSDQTWLLQSQGIGLLPLIMQIVHNNYTGGISALQLRVENDTFTLIVREGDTVSSLPIGFGRGKVTTIMENGEPYLVGTTGAFGLDEQGIPVLSLRISPLEEANERYLKIRLVSPERLELHFSETPGNAIAEKLLSRVADAGSSHSLKSQILSRLSPEALNLIVTGAIEPSVTAIPYENIQETLKTDQPLQLTGESETGKEIETKGDQNER